MLRKAKKNGFYRLVNQKTGQNKIIKNYKNGMLHGKMVYYWDNGNIRLVGQYDKMKRTGIWKTYNPEGNLILEENYNLHKKKSNQLNLLKI